MRAGVLIARSSKPSKADRVYGCICFLTFAEGRSDLRRVRVFVALSVTVAVVYHGHGGKDEMCGKRVVLMDDPFERQGEDEMQFRLTYQGKLLSNGHHRHRHEIRKYLHPQLRALWYAIPSLKGMREPPVQLVEFDRNINSGKSRVEGLAERFARNGYHFVPLITDDLDVSFCGLEILYLRNGAPGGIVKLGDIDNRLKTLFDALRMPEGKSELGGYDAPEEGEEPFFCLLQDDSMITKIAVETDILLEPVGDSFDVNDARLVITVTVQPRTVRLDLQFNTINFRS